MHDEIERRLQSEGARVDDWRYCFHHPEGTDSELAGPCDCRKPAPGLLFAAARTLGIADLSCSWMIGDSDVDILAGRAAGCRTILIDHPASAHRRRGAEPDLRASDLPEAAGLVLAPMESRRARA